MSVVFSDKALGEIQGIVVAMNKIILEIMILHFTQVRKLMYDPLVKAGTHDLICILGSAMCFLCDFGKTSLGLNGKFTMPSNSSHNHTGLLLGCFLN